MDWLPTPSDPAGIYAAADAVVIGTTDVDGSDRILQVTGKTGLDAGAITTDGLGSILCQTTAEAWTLEGDDQYSTTRFILGAIVDAFDSALIGFPGLSIYEDTSQTGAKPAVICAGAASRPDQNDLVLAAGTDAGAVNLGSVLIDAASLGFLRAPRTGTLVAPPAGLLVGELWMDTTTSVQYPIVRYRAS